MVLLTIVCLVACFIVCPFANHFYLFFCRSVLLLLVSTWLEVDSLIDRLIVWSIDCWVTGYLASFGHFFWFIHDMASSHLLYLHALCLCACFASCNSCSGPLLGQTKPMDRSIDQSIDRSIDQSIDRSINRSINRTTNERTTTNDHGCSSEFMIENSLRCKWSFSSKDFSIRLISDSHLLIKHSSVRGEALPNMRFKRLTTSH